MARTVMLVGLLMMSGFVAMIMLNLSHAHSELDSLQNVMEVHERDLKSVSQASNQVAAELRGKLGILANLTSRQEHQQASQEQQGKKLSALGEAQRKTVDEVQQTQTNIEELRRKVNMQEQEKEGMGEELFNLKDEFVRLREEVVALAAVQAAQNASRERWERWEQSRAPEAPKVKAPKAPKAPKAEAEASAAEEVEAEEAAEMEEEQASPMARGFKDVPTQSGEDEEEETRASERTSRGPQRDGKLKLLTTGGPSVVKGPSAGTEKPRAGTKLGTTMPGKTSPAEGVVRSTTKETGVRGGAISTSAPETMDDFQGAGAAFDASQVIWFRECGCTGIEIEAVTLLRGLVARLGSERIKTNRCEQSCKWPAEVQQVLNQISEDEDNLFPSPNRESSSHRVVVVVHAAFLGVCGMNENLESVLQGKAGRKGLVLVSRSMVEQDKIEEGLAEQCSRFDAVWVPSSQSQEAFLASGVAKEKIKILPEAVDTEMFNCTPQSNPFHFSLKQLEQFVHHKPQNSFTFLSMFKWEPRKNWEGLLGSFIESFPDPYTLLATPDGRQLNVSVRLLIKTQSLSWSTDPYVDIQELLHRMKPADPTLQGRMLFIDQVLSSSEIPPLYKVADAFVLPSHGEGWGLPIIEAMASGLPTISTGWGGQMDFMSPENSWPVNYELVESQPGAGRWAEPDRTVLQEAMREVIVGGEAVANKVDLACEEVHRHFSIPVVTKVALQLLESLEAVQLQA